MGMDTRGFEIIGSKDYLVGKYVKNGKHKKAEHCGRQWGHRHSQILLQSIYIASPYPSSVDKVPGEIKRSRDLEEGGGAGPSS